MKAPSACSPLPKALGDNTARFLDDAQVYNRAISLVEAAELAGKQTMVCEDRFYQEDVTEALALQDKSVGAASYFLGDRLIATNEGGTLRYVHPDSLGSSSVVTDTSGTVVDSQTYKPFGDTWTSSGTFGTDRKFTGQRFDGGSGLYFYGGRYYDPVLGRFISADSFVPGSANLQAWGRYSYVLNNPLRYVDPTGQWHRPDEEQLISYLDNACDEDCYPSQAALDLYRVISNEHQMVTTYEIVHGVKIPRTASVAKALKGATGIAFLQGAISLSQLNRGDAVLAPNGDTVTITSTGGNDMRVPVDHARFGLVDAFVKQQGRLLRPSDDREAWFPIEGHMFTRDAVGSVALWILMHEVVHSKQTFFLGTVLYLLLYIEAETDDYEGHWMENWTSAPGYVVISH